MTFQSIFNIFMGIGGLGGLALIIKALAERNKSSAEAEVTIADGALRQMVRMEQEIARMDERLKTQDDKLGAQDDKISEQNIKIERLTEELNKYRELHGPLDAA